MWFQLDNAALTAAQAACVALPAAGLPVALRRFTGGGWALVAPLSIAVVIALVAAIPTTAEVITWVALLLIPPGCALGLGWGMRGSRWWLASAVAPLLALAWADQHAPAGELATIVLIAGSCVLLGRLLAGATPMLLLKAGLVAMATVDAILVFGNQLQAPNAVLNAAAPGAGLPQLQYAALHGASMGYGDLLAAGVLGGLVALQRGPVLGAVVAFLVVSLAFDQLFLVVDTLPATVPPALVLVGLEAVRRLRAAPRGRRPTARPSG
jgi:hypothetical protein